MRNYILSSALVLGGCALGPATGQATVTLPGLAGSGSAASVPAAPTPEDYVPPEPEQLTAQTLRAYDAPEADQGVAVDRGHFYAIDNTVIAKYERASGRRVGVFAAPRRGPIRHLNSCFVEGARLWCANSNYPLTPMGSSIEVFDTRTLAHVESHSLGLTEEGSLTWFARYARGWIASFAHYDDGDGRVAYKDHRFSSVVTHDRDWRRTGGWLLPDSVLTRLAPDAASGGALGPDRLLYIMGHDRPEMYVLARPRMGPSLVHVATISVEAEGQAFTFDGPPSRDVFVIDRKAGKVRQLRLPVVDMPIQDARIF